MFDKVEYVICVHVHAPTPPLAQCQLSPGWRWAPKPPSLIPPPANRLPDWHRLKVDLFGKLHKAGNSPTCSSKALQEVDSLGLSPLVELGGALWCSRLVRVAPKDKTCLRSSNHLVPTIASYHQPQHNHLDNYHQPLSPP